jgi:hypothetical protein
VQSAARLSNEDAALAGSGTGNGVVLAGLAAVVSGGSEATLADDLGEGPEDAGGVHSFRHWQEGRRSCRSHSIEQVQDQQQEQGACVDELAQAPAGDQESSKVRRLLQRRPCVIM